MEKIKTMLDKYFKDYDGSYIKLYENLKGYIEFEGEIDKLGSNFFSGVKVYPPLGFDPWPDSEPEELEKVKYLYEYCQAKAIPITTHCSDGGYIVGDPKESEKRTMPDRWEPILYKYPLLKVNFAHFGKTSKFWNIFGRDKWANKILELILKYDNVYTDFSCCAFGDKFYKEMNNKVRCYDKAAREKLERRIMFGSDFMINLLYINSYSSYLQIFSDSIVLDSEQKKRYCNENPISFLFSK